MSEENNVPLPEGTTYGITLFQTDDDRPIVHVVGDPDIGQLQRLLGAALANLQADIVAEKVIQKMDARRSNIVVPGRD